MHRKKGEGAGSKGGGGGWRKREWGVPLCGGVAAALTSVRDADACSLVPPLRIPARPRASATAQCDAHCGAYTRRACGRVPHGGAAAAPCRDAMVALRGSQGEGVRG